MYEVDGKTGKMYGKESLVNLCGVKMYHICIFDELKSIISIHILWYWERLQFTKCVLMQSAAISTLLSFYYKISTKSKVPPVNGIGKKIV